MEVIHHESMNQLPKGIWTMRCMESSTGWWLGTFFIHGFSISCMGCHPSHWLSYCSEGLKPPPSQDPWSPGCKNWRPSFGTCIFEQQGNPGCTLLFHQNINQKWSINLLMIATFLRCLASPGRRKKARTQRGTPPWSTMAMDNHPREKGRSYAWRHVDIDR